MLVFFYSICWLLCENRLGGVSVVLLVLVWYWVLVSGVCSGLMLNCMVSWLVVNSGFSVVSDGCRLKLFVFRCFRLVWGRVRFVCMWV